MFHPTINRMKMFREKPDLGGSINENAELLPSGN
jgi:hypothetical protein